MRITFVTFRPGLAGGSRVTALHARQLARLGHEVVVVSQPLSRPGLRSRARTLLRTGRSARPALKSPYLDHADIDYRIIEAQRPIIDADLPDADAVIATWWETAYWVAALSPAKGRKFHFIQGHEVFAHLPWQISRGSYYLPLRKIAVSQWLVDIMAREYGCHDTALVPNSVDLDQFHAAPRGRQQIPTVGLVYSAAPFKGIDTAFEAIEKARAGLPELRVIAFGSTDPALGLPLPSGTHYYRRPAQEEIRNIYAACDAWLFPSRQEGFGLPLLEAMACRTPVVATRAGAAPDLIRNGVNGYLVDVEDSSALAARLLSVLSLSQEEWRRMSDAALAVAENHTWEGATALFERALQERTP